MQEATHVKAIRNKTTNDYKITTGLGRLPLENNSLFSWR
jgi:hypothetical protein